MKAYLLAGFLLSYTALFAQAPVSSSVAIPQANVLIVRTTDSLSVAFQTFTRALLAAGYGLDKVEPAANYLATTLHPTSTRPAVKVISRAAFFRERDCTRIEIRGSYSLSGPATTTVSNRGQSGSATAAAWQDLQRVTLLYPNGIVAYRREP